MNSFFIECPYCSGIIEIKKNQINCKIFTHAVYKKDGKQVNPHISEVEIMKLKANNEIMGCGLQFKFDGKNLEKCKGL